jgi:hypothetical protein
MAGAATALLYLALPDDLDVSTDIVGYPVFADFNIYRSLWAYGLLTVFLPLATVALFLVLSWLFVGRQAGRGPVPRVLPRVEEAPVPLGRRRLLVAGGRAGLVSVVLGLEGASVASGREQEIFWLTAVGYLAAVSATAWIVARGTGRDAVDVASCINTVAAPLTVMGLYAVSESTQVTVSATGAVHEYPWLPLWLAAGVAAALLVVAVLGLAHAETEALRSAVERRALLLVVAPVGVFLFMASLPGAMGPTDAFEEGQTLAGSELVRDGLVPWRDLLMAHGLLFDVGSGLVGAELVDDSRWGIFAGLTLIVYPLSWVALYYLCASLFGANWLFLLGTQLLVFTGDLFVVHTRFLLLPFVLVLLAALLASATVARAVAFTSLLAVQVIVTPEAMVAAVAFVGALVVFECVYYERGRGVLAGFRRTLLCLGTALVVAVVWSAFLGGFGVLDDWAFSFTTLLPGHALTGGIPFGVSLSDFEVVAPVALVLGAFTFVVVRTHLRRPLAVQDWVMVAMAGLTLLYYPKFLGRANEFHLDHAYAVAVPLLLYVAYRGVTFAEGALFERARARGLDWFPPRHTVTPFLLFALLLAMPVSLPDAARAVPGRFDATVPSEPAVAKSGYQRPGETDARLLEDLGRTLAPLLEPGHEIFDFANGPGVFHYLLDLRPSTRYYHVSLAMRRRTQGDLVRSLEMARPAVVVLTSTGELRSQFALDGVANQVRYYDVSRYLLANYVPVSESHGFVFMRRRSEGVTEDRTLYFRAPPCDWGFAPNFFAPGPERSSRVLRVAVDELEPGHVWALRLPEGSSSTQWLELETAGPLREGRFVLTDREPAASASSRSIAFNALERTGTRLRVLVGACSQWHGYAPGTLYLRSDVPQELRAVRLLTPSR